MNCLSFTEEVRRVLCEVRTGLTYSTDDLKCLVMRRGEERREVDQGFYSV
jgi:hypothetical protein